MVNSVSASWLIPTQVEQQILAAIDLGTNSLHMVVVKVEPTLPTFTIIAREKEPVRLGDRDLITGNLKLEVIKRAIATLSRFQEIAKTHNANTTIAVATSAVREAPNGKEFLQQVDEQLGLKVDLISGQEEARRIYLGVLSGMEFNDRSHIIIDIGGGSTELILGDSHEARSLSSTKIGAVRLTTERITTDPISDREFNYLTAHVRGALERPIEELRAFLQPGEVARLVGTAGTIETLATINAREKLGLTPSPLTGYQLSLKDLQDIVNRLRKLNYTERAAIAGISESRSEIILAGAIILLEAMKLLSIDTLTVCERSLREGIIVNWMLAHGLIEDRLRYQSSIRQRNVIKTAQKYQVNLDHSDRVASFAIALFDQLQGKLHNWGVEERQLLWAAAMLHNCGYHVNHAAHHKHSYYLIRYGELLGYTETELEIIANIARYHRRSAPKKKHENYRNLSKNSRQLVSQVSAFLRLAVALDRRQIGAISQLRCKYDPTTQELYLYLKAANANDDCALELWSLDTKKAIFEAEYGVKLTASLDRTPIYLKA
ncbi:MAG: Ppx/GppA family phosphatase [Chroococcus sp. CMT-3BRIN-NPC107]|jgi:exopolyphosphatase/guanosine-5'-triphosphate,3'-diphosphate pyrophosphatase|nr:Ppx/GppA family phosphatase [Chroococcus sp. CMT-3BRIN-NPC107]